jgi:hypothetical protein
MDLARLFFQEWYWKNCFIAVKIVLIFMVHVAVWSNFGFVCGNMVRHLNCPMSNHDFTTWPLDLIRFESKFLPLFRFYLYKKKLIQSHKFSLGRSVCITVYELTMWVVLDNRCISYVSFVQKKLIMASYLKALYPNVHLNLMRRA